MSEQRKYIGKKRQKIFSIEKSYSQMTQKNVTIEKYNASPVENLFPTEDIPPVESHKLILNLEEINEKNSAETQKHSLINISTLVFEFIKTVGHTTGNEVTTHIKNVIYSKNKNQPNQKNIQRRVYDAINVMCAAGLIKKNKQEIQFIGHNAEENGLNNFNDGINLDEKKEEEKRKNLIKNYLTLKFYEKYNKLDELYPQRKFQKRF